MKGLFIGLSVCIVLSNGFAEGPTTLWEKTFGGYVDDAGYSVQQTVDGGYIVTGSTNSYGTGGSDVWLIKTDASGNTLWTKTYGDTGNDMGYVVQQTFDRGYIITGNTNIAGNIEFLLIKTDSLGDTLWTRIWGMTGQWDCGFSVQQTSDSGYIVAGCGHDSLDPDYDLYLMKTDVSGDTLWTRIYGDSMSNWGESVQQTFDNGYIIAGRTILSNDEGFIWLLKTDSLGDTVWTKTFNETSWNKGRAVQQTFDSGYIVVGYTATIPEDICLIKTDSNGDTMWTRIFGGDLSDISYSLQQTSDSGYIITGYTKSYGAGDYDVWLIKTDASGDTLWTRIFGGISNDRGYSVQETEDGGYIVAGLTGSSGAGGNDLWLIKTSSTGVEENEKFKMKNEKLKIEENPVVQGTVISYQLSVKAKVELKVYDLTGKAVRTLVEGEKSAGKYDVKFNGNSLRNGVYFVVLNTGKHSESRKIVLMK